MIVTVRPCSEQAFFFKNRVRFLESLLGGELFCVHLCHRFEGEHVSGPDHVATVAIQRRVGVRICEEVDYCARQALESPGWRIVLGFEDVEADLARREVDVRVETFGDHLDLGRLDGVILVDLEIQLEPTPTVGRVRGPSHQPPPHIEVIVDWSEEDISVLAPASLQ